MKCIDRDRHSVDREPVNRFHHPVQPATPEKKETKKRGRQEKRRFSERRESERGKVKEEKEGRKGREEGGSDMRRGA